MFLNFHDEEFEKSYEIEKRHDQPHGDKIECIEYTIDGGEHKLEVKSHHLTGAEPEWQITGKGDDDSVTRMLSKRIDRCPSAGSSFEFPKNVTSKLGLKEHISLTDSSGTVAFMQSGRTSFVLQTPLDGGPFCFASAQQDKGFNFSTLFLYSDPIFTPCKMLQDQMWLIRWRWSGMPVFMLPIAFAHAHDAYVSSCLVRMNAELDAIENSLLATHVSDIENVDFGRLTRQLHTFSTTLSNLNRRAHFQNTLLSTIKEASSTLDDVKGAKIRRARFAALEKSMQSREYDLEMMPKREQTARATIFNLVVQRDQAIALATGRANLEIAKSSKQIAEATMRDSAAMRTIAILTLIFLPPTAVASFFSITMFNWDQTDGQSVSSRYVWVYFVVAVPLTAMVVGIWWYWHGRQQRIKSQPSEEMEMEFPRP